MPTGIKQGYTVVGSADVHRQHIAHLVRISPRYCFALMRGFNPGLPSVGMVPLQVAMNDFGLEALFIQKVADVLGKRHRTMPSSGTADGNGQVTLALADVV